MQIIKELSKKIRDELDDAEAYAKCALNHQTDYPEVAKLYYTLSGQELEHMNMLHNAVAKIINDYRREHGEPPAAMQAVYDYLHEEYIERTVQIKNLQSLFK